MRKNHLLMVKTAKYQESGSRLLNSFKGFPFIAGPPCQQSQNFSIGLHDVHVSVFSNRVSHKI